VIVALNLANMLKAPRYFYEVTMTRCIGMNAVQNARKRIAYVTASNDEDAKREARRQFPQFFPTSTRKVSP
jgi:hypothetical protein